MPVGAALNRDASNCGRVTRWAMPAGPGVRVDTAIEALVALAEMELAARDDGHALQLVDKILAEEQDEQVRLLLVGHVIAEPLQGEQETGVGPERVDEITRRARQRETALGQSAPWEKLARILLARRCHVGMTDDVAAANAVTLLDVRDQRDQRRPEDERPQPRDRRRVPLRRLRSPRSAPCSTSTVSNVITWTTG